MQSHKQLRGKANGKFEIQKEYPIVKAYSVESMIEKERKEQSIHPDEAKP